MTRESSTERILEIIDAGLAEVPAPVYGRGGQCWRCGSAADEEVCGECRAFLLGDSEKDPASRLLAAVSMDPCQCPLCWCPICGLDLDGETGVHECAPATGQPMGIVASIEVAAEPGDGWDALVAYLNQAHAEMTERAAERQRQADWDRATDAAGLPRVMPPYEWQHSEHIRLWALIHDPGDWRYQRTVLTITDEILADGDPEMLRGWLRRMGVPLYDDAALGDLLRLIPRLPDGAPLYVTPDEHAELARVIPTATAGEWDPVADRPHTGWAGIAVVIDAEAAVRQRRDLLG